jgi:excisionase family DNA binding protein
VSELVTTTQAAREVGVARSTLVSWVHQGWLEPHATTMGGHYRWDVDRLKDEIRAVQQRRREQS